MRVHPRHPHLRRGMKPWRRDAIALRLSRYVRRDRLPAVPAQYGLVGGSAVAWGMQANDAAGDCVIAGAEHETMTWKLATGQPVPAFGDSVSIANYSAALVAEGHSPYNPQVPSTDTGLDPVAAASWRQKVGLRDAAGNVHKIDAFVSLDTPEELDLAAYLFGACGVGFNLPDTAEDQFAQHVPWSDTSGPGTGGHYVPLVGRNSNGIRFFITWGALQGATADWISTYLVGAVAYLSREYMMATGKSPDGIDWKQLASDLHALPHAA